MMKNMLIGILKTTFAFFIVALLLLFSGKILNFLPAIIFIPVAITYILSSMLFYFVIAADDIFSTILGILIGIIFIVTWGINVSMAETIFGKGIYAFGILLGLLQIIKSATFRFKGSQYVK